MGVVSLGIPNKADITITADGYDENKAIREFEKQLRALKVIQ
jgi:phosphocarrier protein